MWNVWGYNFVLRFLIYHLSIMRQTTQKLQPVNFWYLCSYISVLRIIIIHKINHSVKRHEWNTSSTKSITARNIWKTPDYTTTCTVCRVNVLLSTTRPLPGLLFVILHTPHWGERCGKISWNQAGGSCFDVDCCYYDYSPLRCPKQVVNG